MILLVVLVDYLKKIVIKVSSAKFNNDHTKSIPVPSKKKEREALSSLSGILMFQLQESIRRCIRSAESCFMAGVTWPYSSRVNATVAWPRFSETVLIGSPIRMAFVA